MSVSITGGGAAGIKKPIVLYEGYIEVNDYAAGVPPDGSYIFPKSPPSIIRIQIMCSGTDATVKISSNKQSGINGLLNSGQPIKDTCLYIFDVVATDKDAGISVSVESSGTDPIGSITVHIIEIPVVTA